jgi:hypothetical protein
MKVLPVYMFLMFLSYGCGEDTPTASGLTLDTTAKETTEYRTIRRYDGENWVDTPLKVQIDKTWRFISHATYTTGQVSVKGGYAFTLSNPSNNRVNFKISQLDFDASDGIPIYEYNISPDINRDIEAKGSAYYTGTFELTMLDNMETLTQINRMSLWASFSQKIE